MASLRGKIFILFVIVGLFVADCEARRKKKVHFKNGKGPMSKQMVLQQKETTSINFSRLVAMRLIYGLASMLGIQDRLGGILNGVFVPPGAEDDDYGFGFGDDDEDDDGGLFGSDDSIF